VPALDFPKPYTRALHTPPVEATWTPSGVTFTYQWYRGSAKIDGATKSTYKLAKVNKGASVSVRVVGSLEGYRNLGKQSAKVKVS